MYGFFGTPIKKIRCYNFAPVKLRGGGEKNHRITSIGGGKEGLLDKRRKPFSRPMELDRPSQRAIESWLGPWPFAVSAATDGDIY